MSIEPGSTIRTPEQTLVWSADGSLLCTREGDREWPAAADAEFDEAQPVYSSLEAFLAVRKPAWWEIHFALPRMAFAKASVLFHEGRGSWAETVGAAHTRFLKEVVTPFVTTWGLARAPDQLARVYLYGTAGSPARKTAEQQFREMEADVRNWARLVWDTPEGEERKRYAALWERYCKATPHEAGPPRPGRPSAFEPAAAGGPVVRESPGNPRLIEVFDRNDRRIAQALKLSDSMVFATMYPEAAAGADAAASKQPSNSHYMPLRHFLEVYRLL